MNSSLREVDTTGYYWVPDGPDGPGWYQLKSDMRLYTTNGECTVAVPKDKMIKQYSSNSRIEYPKHEPKYIDTRIAALGNAWDF